jgi:hypothetical protein
MSMPYVYYTVKPGSPAYRAVSDKIESTERMVAQAHVVGDKWLKQYGVDYKIVTAGDCKFVGFRPDSWDDAKDKLGASFHWLWAQKEEASCSWLTPRKRPVYDGQEELAADVATIPDVESWETLSYRLFGFDRFVFGMSAALMTASISDQHRIVGVPWMAAQGAAGSFGPPREFKPMKGLVKLPFEKAMLLLHGDEMEKRRAFCKAAFDKYQAQQKEAKK